ncbi:DEAD/DEAH box helicase domain protein [Desulfobulbus propionicus DSM 2032]|jgi:ATP-dependent RNA helicase DeaD|uniref:DEAD-box ATP-dependent RNA helicase RhpA n=1 Tax=Desulfobulbus propionicus (strain ATCC 33891 / DSM 2032 / VKM B-1956 / 1pr3) TaxID=577650 RepID=A0A7U3YQ24_DESPD|nr:DEAD/DEAH box helicase [Desulfobulbus propionicus]ADW19328.1 DEAD/DEAH box helicase domain protein [Desulfobulbus propionicus DSM 2032]
MTTATFARFGLHPDLVQTVTELGFTDPTPIQQAAIPLLLEGRDLIGQAQTGTGKTAAFGLPLLQRITPRQQGVQALVLAPTRELAIQVAEAIQRYGQQRGITVLAVYGGQAYQQQIRSLRQGVEVIVGTPGRLLDLMNQGTLDLTTVRTVVLDEADEMLSMGFVEDIELILDRIPAERQTMLFSATISKRVLGLSARYLRDPETVSITPKQLTGATIEQRYYLVNQQDKVAALTRLFEMETIDSALIFTRTRIGTGELANQLTSRGFPAEALNGDLSQDARIQVLNRFRNGQVKVLVATDVAARGLDIDDISHVFNFDLPDDPEVYVHRVGRTGRAGREGIAISLLTPKDRWILRRIEDYARYKLTRAELPTIQQIENHRQALLMEQLEVWIRRGRCRREREVVEMLLQTGHQAEDIAAAALKLARGEEKKRPIDPITPIKEEQFNPRERKNDRFPRRGGQAGTGPGGRRGHDRDRDMVPLRLNVGRADGVGVNHVVASLAHYSGVAAVQLGKIRLEADHTLVDVPEPLVGRLLSKNGAYRIGRRAVNLERA